MGKHILSSTVLTSGVVAISFSMPALTAPGIHTNNQPVVTHPAASTPPDTDRTLNLLRKQSEENGTIRIIVGLRLAFAPEGTMDADSGAQQRNEIARMQSAVLGKISSLQQRPESIKRYASIPFMTLEVSTAELNALASLGEITSIEADRIATPALGNRIALPVGN